MEIIKINDANYWYPEEKSKTLNNVNLSIEKGEMVLIMGPSGSGKSTLGKIMTGAVPNFYGGTFGGEVLLNNISIRKLDHRKLATTVTMVFQDPERQLVMNKVYRDIALGLENLEVDPKEIDRRLWEAMEFIGIAHLAERNSNTLSGGEKQKVAIASALAYQPECIILDEPTSQLDPSAAEDIINIIHRINDELGITVIVIEQRVSGWFNKANRIVFMESGGVSFNGTPHDFYNKYNSDYLPETLNIAKAIGMKDLPSNNREIRRAILESDIDICKYGGKDRNSDSCIIARGINLFYDGKQVLKNIDLQVNKGDFITIMGSNGAGKTSLIKAICGLIKYDGSIKLLEREIKKMKIREIASIVGYVSQNPNDYISKDSVYEEVKFTLDNFGIDDYSRIDDVLKRLGLSQLKEKNPRDLSGGEKQRLAIASVLVMFPKILILDEPTRGMDPIVKGRLGEILRELNDKGMTIIMITHDIDFASKYSNNFILMFNGRITSAGDIQQVMQDNIYYTTSVNKLFRGIRKDMFSMNQLGANYE